MMNGYAEYVPSEMLNQLRMSILLRTKAKSDTVENVSFQRDIRQQTGKYLQLLRHNGFIYFKRIACENQIKT